MNRRTYVLVGIVAVTLAVIGLVQVLNQVLVRSLGPVVAGDIGHLVVFVVVEAVLIYFIGTALLLLITPQKLRYMIAKYYRRAVSTASYRQIVGAATGGQEPVDLDPPRQAWSRSFLRASGAVLLVVAVAGEYVFTHFWFS